MNLRRFASILVGLAMTASLSLVAVGNANAAPAQSAQQPAGTVTRPVTGSFTDASGGTGTFSGQFAITRFINQNGSVAAVGTVTGTLTDSAGTVLGTDSQQVTAPVELLQATCEILNLELGPLDLDLLGLVVHLDEVLLNITAEQGPGNLLGNLLCAVARLLDPNQTNGLVALLNRILSILG
jgi:hypothetical protein